MNYLIPNWPAPPSIKAFVTTRKLIHAPSSGYQNFNLATHVGDHAENVEKNRLQLYQELRLPSPPIWLNQIHGH